MLVLSHKAFVNSFPLICLRFPLIYLGLPHEFPLMYAGFPSLCSRDKTFNSMEETVHSVQGHPGIITT
jgi:hypothetical protein